MLDDDPICQWFRIPAATELRLLQRAIDVVLVGSPQRNDLSVFSDLAAFYYTAAFETCRGLLTTFRSTNPTWIRIPKNGRLKLSPSRDRIINLFLQSVDKLAERLNVQSDKIDRAGRVDGAQIFLGDSRQLPVETDSVSACLTSPPYCTRIDYVIATRAELAIMNIKFEALRTLRERCIGSPTMRATQKTVSINNDSAQRLVKRIKTHGSWAADSYYAPYFTNYVSDLEKSISEIHRVVSTTGRIGLVVQDSYFKDIHIDLQGLVVSMMKDQRRSLSERHDFKVGASRVKMNPRSQVYLKSKTPKESLLIFE